MARYSKREIGVFLVLAALLIGAPVCARADSSDDAALAAEKAAEQDLYDATMQIGDYAPVDDGTLNNAAMGILPGEDPAEKKKKKYVYDKAGKGPFYGAYLPKRVFNNIPPRK